MNDRGGGLTSVLRDLDILVHGERDHMGLGLACCRSSATAQCRSDTVVHQREVTIRWDEG
jgi:hypothetical protein